MKLIVNGEERAFDAEMTIPALLDALGAEAGRTAVMVNDRIVKRGQREACVLHDGDRVEIIQMVGGG